MKNLILFLEILAEVAHLFASLIFTTQAVIHFREKDFISFGFDVALAACCLLCLLWG